MAYYSTYKRRKLSRGRYRVGRRYGYRRRTNRLKRFIKKVAGRMSEVKWQTAISVTNFTNEGGVFDPPDLSNRGFLVLALPAIAQSSSTHGRIGNQIRYKYFKFHWEMYTSLTMTRAWMPVRILLFVPLSSFPRALNSEPSSANAYSFIFDGPPGPTQHLNTVNNKNVRVLYDKTIILSRSLAYNETGFRGQYINKVGRRIYNQVTFRSDIEQFPFEPKDLIYCYVTWQGVTGANQLDAAFRFVSRISYRDC